MEEEAEESEEGGRAGWGRRREVLSGDGEGAGGDRRACRPARGAHSRVDLSSAHCSCLVGSGEFMASCSHDNTVKFWGVGYLYQDDDDDELSLIHISEPTRPRLI
eukprot:2042905-Rhodomonas_salina.1